VDCLQKALWATSQGGPALAEDIVKRDRPMDLIYLGAPFQVLQGDEHLTFMKLRDGAHSTNLVAGCCHTTMAVDHPCLEDKAVLVFTDIARLVAAPNADDAAMGDPTVNAMVLPPPSYVGYVKDLSERQRAALLADPPPGVPIIIDTSALTDSEAAVRGQHMALRLAEAQPGAEGMLFKQHLQRHGGATVVLGLTEGALEPPFI
jgi:hypothetical protein